MERKVQKPKAKPTSFQCPVCGGTIVCVIVARQPYELRQWICNLCKTTFGPRWGTEYWGDRPGVILVGPEPLPDKEAEGAVLSGTLELLAGQATSKGEIAYRIMKTLVSILLAS